MRSSLASNISLTLDTVLPTTSEGTTSQILKEPLTSVSSNFSLEDQPVKTSTFHLDILKKEMKTISLPCLVVSLVIIILCMVICELLYKTVMNNVIPGLFRL